MYREKESMSRQNKTRRILRRSRKAQSSIEHTRSRGTFPLYIRYDDMALRNNTHRENLLFEMSIDDRGNNIQSDQAINFVASRLLEAPFSSFFQWQYSNRCERHKTYLIYSIWQLCWSAKRHCQVMSSHVDFDVFRMRAREWVFSNG